mmetsp:Transcript_6909/g.12884  ORF Transcript_6909/g.12884 Transcript_6909/m.12884 type:complete len:221 (-) Transcript_6909:603-1265(-)
MVAERRHIQGCGAVGLQLCVHIRPGVAEQSRHRSHVAVVRRRVQGSAAAGAQPRIGLRPRLQQHLHRPRPARLGRSVQGRQPPARARPARARSGPQQHLHQRGSPQRRRHHQRRAPVREHMVWVHAFVQCHRRHQQLHCRRVARPRARPAHRTLRNLSRRLLRVVSRTRRLRLVVSRNRQRRVRKQDIHALLVQQGLLYALIESVIERDLITWLPTESCV